MDKQSHPQTLGVFAPVGHVIVSFPTQQDMSAAADAMRDAGFADEHITRYTSDQMREQVDIDLAKASPIANLGQEINRTISGNMNTSGAVIVLVTAILVLVGGIAFPFVVLASLYGWTLSMTPAW